MLINLKTLVENYNLKVKGIIHIGAHYLEEKETYEKLNIYNVIWIEGNPSIFEDISQKYGKECRIFNSLISNSDEKTIDFHVTNDSQSSSIYKLGSHKYFYSKIEAEKTISVVNSKLKDFIEQHKISLNNFNFLNLDIQGAELDAIRSLEERIEEINYIYTEVNIGRLYKNCPLLSDIDTYLYNKGFIRKELKLTSEGWGDAFYVRDDHIKQEDFQLNYDEAIKKEAETPKREFLLSLIYPIKKLKHFLFND